MALNIAIIGQGVSGTSTALAILEIHPSMKITLFADRPFEDTCSYGPGGHFEIMEAEHKKWGLISFERFAKLEKEFGPKIGVKYVSGFVQSDNETFIEKLGEFNAEIVHNYRKMNSREMKHIFSEPLKYGIHYSTYSTQGRLYVPWLKSQCEKYGAKFIRREIHSIEELADEGYDIVINCAGLHGGKVSKDDNEMSPLRGIAFEIDAPGWKHFSFSELETFVIPLDNTILAGTVRQPGRYDRTITEEDRREVLHRIYKLHPTLKSHKINAEWCGLRPCRDSVRLERQTRKSLNGKTFEVLHNYGHGSNGFTLSWGCAQEVLGLLNQILSENRVDTPSKL
uniref:FAD dependent oxidoreductase domain-containing protein n=1 Tax=Panagrolaimus sp. PS1159 TaxID=55785 RepID=A0AC35ESF8_9BILA